MRGVRTGIACVVFASVAVAGGVVWLSVGRPSPIRNVLLISIDTCRADHLSCYGYFRQTTPHIDAIASDGVLFTHAQSTNPITLPAHCSMLTGTNPIFHGVHANDHPDLDDSNVTLAEIMQDHGYQTGAVIGAFPLHSRFGLNQGFDDYDERLGRSSERLLFNERDAQKVSRTAIQWLEQPRDKPFFLFVHYFDPHHFYTPPEPFASTFADNLYAGEIAYTDFCIGQIIETLKKLDLFDSTLLIITADHGESLGDHNEDTHSFFIYQSTIRVPLIIRAPGCAAGHKVDDAVSLIDIVPTVLGSLDLSVPPQVQGVDLSAYLRGRGEEAEDRFLYSESWYPASFGCSPVRGLVHGKWRYIWSVRPELYDLNRDPGETNNLVEEEPQLAKRLQSRLRKMLADQRRSPGEGHSVGPDPETLQQLQSVGYVSGPMVVVDAGIGQDMEDPKDEIGIYQQYLLAQAYWDEDQLDMAKDLCLEILARRPKLEPALLLLGSVAVDQGRVADAINHYSHVLEVAAKREHPGTFTFKVHQDRGDAYVDLGNHALALDDFNKAIKLKPDYVVAYTNRGNVYTKLGNYDRALADYAQALRLAPDYEDAYFNRGIAHGLLSSHDRALADFSRVIELKPGYAEAYFNRGNAYRDLGSTDRALADYAKAIELKPQYAEAYNNRGNVYTGLGSTDRALADYAKAIELKPQYAEAYNNRGTVFAMLGRYEPAASDFTRLIELKPDFTDAYTIRGHVYTELGRYDLALGDFTRAIKRNPQYTRAHLGLARFLATCVDPEYRDGQKALASAKRAQELSGGDDFITLETMAAAYAEIGRFAEAVKCQTRALALAPPGAKENFRSRLRLYQSGKPYRQ